MVPKGVIVLLLLRLLPNSTALPQGWRVGMEKAYSLVRPSKKQEDSSWLYLISKLSCMSYTALVSLILLTIWRKYKDRDLKRLLAYMPYNLNLRIGIWNEFCHQLRNGEYIPLSVYR